MSDTEFEDWASRLKTIAHPIRLHLVACLLEASATDVELAERMGNALGVVQDQLQILVAGGLVQRDEGRLFSLSPEVSMAWLALGDDATIDLGCCKLSLTQIARPDASEA